MESQKDSMTKRQKSKLRWREKRQKKDQWQTPCSVCEVESYTICVQICFERKYTVYKFDSTMR